MPRQVLALATVLLTVACARTQEPIAMDGRSFLEPADPAGTERLRALGYVE